MKIGIITYHWAANYGAVLQAYALQEYIKEKGHSPEIIDYRPFSLNYNFWYIVKHPKSILYFREILRFVLKNRKLERFRKKCMILSNRYSSYDELLSATNKYNILISGSDQILNPTFTEFGENKPTPSYFLKFNNSARKIGYAVSFGCEKYPDSASKYARKWIQDFEKIGVRETTGLSILNDLQYSNPSTIVPDPTLLMGSKLLRKLKISFSDKHGCLCIYLLRRNFNLKVGDAIIIDESSKPYYLEGWVSLIANSNYLITNSYHGMIVAILSHVPFSVLLEEGPYSGMNDRFITLLNYLGLNDRIVYNETRALNLLESKINWEAVDERIVRFQNVGAEFLKF